ncbi:MAG: cupin domain-containing protein [Gaiellaceae bacterium]
MTHAFGSLDELGDGYGFRKIRAALGVEAFGVNAIVYPPNYEGPEHYHDTQDELYFVHRGRIRVDVDGESRELGEGGLFHASSTTPRRISNAGDEAAIVFVIGGKDGYVERDGHLVNPDVDLPRRQGLG